MKQPVALMLSLTLFFSTIPAVVSASTFTSTVGSIDTGTTLTGQVMTPKKIMVYIKPDFTVQWNGVTQTFKDVHGMAVYPLVYNGSTYLPVRAVSALMKEPIEYNSRFQIIFIGKTLTDTGVGISYEAATSVPSGSALRVPQPSSQIAWTKPDLLVMYNYAIQTFQDANGMIVYPIIYNGTTYLPIRAIADLMKEPVAFDNQTKVIAIGDGEDSTIDTSQSDDVTTKTALQILTEFYNEETMLYDESTAKIMNIKIAVTAEEKMVLAASISEDHLEAQEIFANFKNIDTSVLSTSERDLYDRIYAFFESTEYYLLVLENIAHLNAQDADYSMLAETFLYFAMDSRTKMQEARP